MDFTPLLPFLDDVGATVLFLVFLWLYHVRTLKTLDILAVTISELVQKLPDSSESGTTVTKR